MAALSGSLSPLVFNGVVFGRDSVEVLVEVKCFPNI